MVVALAVWYAARHSPHLAHAIARAPHQQHAFRLRHRTSLPDLQRLRQELQRRRAVAAQTVYECPSCGERLVGERRCPECHLFSRAIGLGGHCPECDTPLLLVDLLGEEVVATH